MDGPGARPRTEQHEDVKIRHLSKQNRVPSTVNNMKKASKASGKACQSSREECGVWLDTVTLKGKQKKPARRPISKLLNPSLGGGGYSLAVALNFTQTRVPMPNTKQSSISSFFAPQSRVQNKRAPSEPANGDVVNPTTTPSSSSSSSSSVSTSPPPEEFGAKRQHEPDAEVLAFLDGEEFRGERARRHRESERAAENEAPVSLSRDDLLGHVDSERDRGYEDGESETKGRPSESSSPPAGPEQCSREEEEVPGRLSKPSDRTESLGGAERYSREVLGRLSEPSARTESLGGAERYSREVPGRLSEPSPRTESLSGEHPGGTESCSQYSYRLQVPTTARDRRLKYATHLLTQDSETSSRFSLTHKEVPTARGEGTALLCEEGFRVSEGAGEERRSTQERRGGGGGEGRRCTKKEKGGGGGEGRTCTRKPRGSQQEEEKEEKENDTSSPSALKSPSERSSLSPPLGNHNTLMQTASWSAPPPGRPWKRAREEEDDDAAASGLASPCKRRRTRSSPLKRAPWSEPEPDDSLATLFTQDSEGFRVIAHRGGGGGGGAGVTASAWSPLKEHGGNHRTLSLKTSVDEEEDEEDEEEMLFTQDSQGNVVIKH